MAHILVHVLVKLLLLCITLFGAVVLLLHMQPYDEDTELRSLVVPSTGCHAPCFMGVELGETTVGAAMFRLKESRRIVPFGASVDHGNAVVETFVPGPSGHIPLFLEAQNGVVEAIRLSSILIRLSDVEFILGQPAQRVFNNTTKQGSITYAAFYPWYEMIVVVDLPACSLDMNTFWDAWRYASVEIETAPGYTERADYYLTGAHKSGAGWAKEMLDIKRASCA